MFTFAVNEGICQVFRWSELLRRLNQELRKHFIKKKRIFQTFLLQAKVERTWTVNGDTSFTSNRSASVQAPANTFHGDFPTPFLDTIIFEQIPTKNFRRKQINWVVTDTFSIFSLFLIFRFASWSENMKFSGDVIKHETKCLSTCHLRCKSFSV